MLVWCFDFDPIGHLTKRLNKNSLTRQFSILFHVILALIAFLFCIDVFTPLEINSQWLKSFVYLGIIVQPPLIVIWSVWKSRSLKLKFTRAIFPSILFIAVLLIGPTKIIFSHGAWRTQTVLYENGHFSNRFIERQMQDVGAFGYNRRTVIATYYTGLFTSSQPFIPSDIENHPEWIEVNREVNELNLKMP